MVRYTHPRRAPGHVAKFCQWSCRAPNEAARWRQRLAVTSSAPSCKITRCSAHSQLDARLFLARDLPQNPRHRSLGSRLCAACIHLLCKVEEKLLAPFSDDWKACTECQLRTADAKSVGLRRGPCLMPCGAEAAPPSLRSQRTWGPTGDRPPSLNLYRPACRMSTSMPGLSGER